MNKHEERFYVERAAEMLGVSWMIGEDRESPDFLVTDGAHEFGLEVSELFRGPVGRKGAVRKAEESNHQRTINQYWRMYEAEKDIPLDVKISGIVNEQTMGDLLRCLLEHDFESMDTGAQTEFHLRENFKIHVTKAFRSRWFRVDDRIGPVNVNPVPVIDRAVKNKSQRLSEYQESVGGDIRLLLVADRIFASGKLKLIEKSPIDTRGFRTVYFMSYPESITVFP